MKKEDFLKMPRHDQETFINEGGTISSDDAIDGRVMISPTVTGSCHQTEQADNSESSFHSPTDPESVSQPVSTSFSDGFDITDPLELLLMLDDDIREGRVTLHDWQVKFLVDFANSFWHDQHPFQSVVRACNGSGKDKYIIAPCVVWLCMRYKLARGVVTSSSGVQLDNQTDTYINHLCTNANRKWANGEQKIWKCNYRYYECLPTE